jgi:hypothetical protein
MKPAVTHALTGALIGLAVLALGALSGCAAKKKLPEPIIGPAVARYKLSECKPLPNLQPGLDCSHVKLIPLTLPVTK